MNILQDQALPAGHNTVNFFIIVKGGADKFLGFVAKVFEGSENKWARTPDKDGLLIHAEIRVGTATLLVADAKPDWPFTPAFPQVYVQDAQKVLDLAREAGARVITEVSDFYNGLKLARFQDPWGNLWWLFEKSESPATPAVQPEADTGWHGQKPSAIYTTLMDAMKNLKGKS
jgi:uncharacterized glyoxalase superfamily protein PhnB